MFPMQGLPLMEERRGVPYQHVDLREYDNIKTDMTDEELVLIPTKDLNKVVKESGILLLVITSTPEHERADQGGRQEDQGEAADPQE